jgi:hypothetical protein
MGADQANGDGPVVGDVGDNDSFRLTIKVIKEVALFVTAILLGLLLGHSYFGSWQVNCLLEYPA